MYVEVILKIFLLLHVSLLCMPLYLENGALAFSYHIHVCSSTKSKLQVHP